MLGVLLSEGLAQTESSYVRWPLSSEMLAGSPSREITSGSPVPMPLSKDYYQLPLLPGGQK